MRINVPPKPAFTHEGAVASQIKPIDELRRTVLACLLWESGFYESGEAVADRIKRLVPLCHPHEVAEIAIEARDKQRLRHAPLLLVRELARDAKRCPDGLIARTLQHVIQRADEPAEFLSLYWKDGKAPLAKQVKKGLAAALTRFDAYALAKYDRANAVRLRDVLFLVHATPKDKAQAAVWKQLVEGTLPAPDTWEVALSAGSDKKDAFERLLREKKLGYMALLRNLRNMQQAEVDASLVFEALQSGAAKSKALPFRYVAAARAVPAWEPQIDAAMQIALGGLEKIPGKTVLLVDVSGSMDASLSAKSDLNRMDAAAALAVLVRGVCEDARVFTFSERLVEVPARSGMALIDAVIHSQRHSATYLGGALEKLRAQLQADRLIVITDEQSHDAVGKPIGRGYIINVATNQRGVGYGDWTHINGFSEAVVQYIAELERQRA
ncbi:TROVE domain-containing protein [Azohydromonas aeria]|uniref:TROVE domain-containing protein n=1 Tax=Azohydromonas aeria TaxID=2590212 RepID=UPI0012FC4351|nr:TROVE domain-containing protein [Azohydromonas aeria]